MNSRVKFIRKCLKMSQETFGNRLGVTAAGISKIEGGQRNLTEQMILMICKEFNINERWLRYGEGEIYKQKLPKGIEEFAEYYQLDEIDKRIIYEYSTLDAKKRKVIKEYIMRIAYGNDNRSSYLDVGLEQEIIRCAEDNSSNDHIEDVNNTMM